MRGFEELRIPEGPALEVQMPPGTGETADQTLGQAATPILKQFSSL